VSVVDLKIEKTHESDEVARLKLLLALAEEQQGARFALIDLGEDRLVITTSSTDDAPSPYELRLFACFSKAWADGQAAFHVGYLHGIRDLARHEYGPATEHWDAEAHDLARAATEACTKAAFVSAELTRIAMAPFGLVRRELEDVVVWSGAKEPSAEEGGGHG
jgi:hypothetical protein